ncbi:unnamed protein product [Cuscuta campestris]|uniref:DUF4283 domain-containing protein n=2 Tax=Cuscuta campestris TaxID=132261 RepID=A0A484LIK3_9ASTE|nr:unnamed protein product [Cuscuta campestris]
MSNSKKGSLPMTPGTVLSKSQSPSTPEQKELMMKHKDCGRLRRCSCVKVGDRTLERLRLHFQRSSYDFFVFTASGERYALQVRGLICKVGISITDFLIASHLIFPDTSSMAFFHIFKAYFQGVTLRDPANPMVLIKLIGSQTIPLGSGSGDKSYADTLGSSSHGHGGSHRQCPAIKKTFIDILGSQPSEAQNRIGRYRGFPAVSVTPGEVISLSIPYQFALVGRFLKSRPPLEVIRKSFEQIGFKPGFTVGLLSSSLILINFECTIDYQRCFSRRLWNINGSQMVVTKWTPSFHADSESPVFLVWVSLTHLPIHLQEAKALHSIASSIRHPLMMDASTAAKTRPSMARFCVEIDISKDLLKKIWIDNGGLGFFQPVTYENLPEFGIQCKKSGHLDGKCSTMDNLISKNELSKNNLSKTWCPISKHEVSNENLPKSAAVMIEPILNIPCELGHKLDSKTSCDTNLNDPSTAGHKKSKVDHHVSDLSPEHKGDELTPQEAMEINLTAFCKEDNPNTQALNVQSDFPTDSHNDVQNSGAEFGKELLTTNTAAVVNQDGVCDPTDATVSDEVDEQSEAEAEYDMEKLTKEADLEHTQEQIIEESMDGMTAQNAYCVGNTINLDEFPVLTRQNIEEDVHTPTENVETVVHTPTEIEKDETTGTITLMAEDTTKETTSPNIPDTNIGPILHSFELEDSGSRPI